MGGILREKKSQLEVLSVLVLIITSLFVGAVVVNESLNESINNTVVESLNGITNNNLSEQPNETVTSETINETEPNMSIMAENQTTDKLNVTTNAGVIQETENDTSIQEGPIVQVNILGNQTRINDTPKIISNRSLNQTSVNYSNIIKNVIAINESPLNKIKPKLAESVNGKSIYTDYYNTVYSKRFNLSRMEFKLVENGLATSTSLKIGNKIDWIKGFTVNNKDYAIHLVGCDKQKTTCNFRINGILIKDRSVGNTFDLTNNYYVKVKSITFNFCDNKKVCDYLFDSYDLVEIEILPK